MIKKRYIIAIILFGLFTLTGLAYLVGGNETIDPVGATLGQVYGVNVLFIDQGARGSEATTFYALSDDQYNYLISNEVFSDPTINNKSTINSKPFTIHKSEKEKKIYNFTFKYLDEVKVVI